MEYKLIHDRIINRARNRIYNSDIHQNHHIIPIHEDPFSTEMVPLTFKEHILIHHIRWRLYEHLEDKLAYCFMSGDWEESHKVYAQLGGLSGGKQTKANKSGIFSETWDRSKQTKKNWDDGLMGESVVQWKLHAKEWGLLSVLSNKGIHAPDYDHSQASKNLWLTGKMENVRKNLLILASLGGQKSKKLGTNFSTWNKEKQKEVASKGGKAHLGKRWWNNSVIVIRQQESPGEGFVIGWKLKGNTKNVIT